MSNTRTAKKSADEILASVQLDASPDQDVRLPKGERAEVKDGRLKVPFKDKQFAVAEELNILPLMEWAASDAETSLAATYRMLKSVVHEDDFAAFASYATAIKAGPELLINFINAAVEAISGRPTEAPGRLSTGLSSPSAGSTGSC